MKVIRESLLALATLATATATARASSMASIESIDRAHPTARAHETTTTPDRIEPHRRPLECRQFLEVRSVKTSEWLKWAHRLSLAACEQARITPPAVTHPEQLRDLVGELATSAQTSIVLYKDAMANGPTQIRMLAAYGLGMAYANIMVQARSAIRSSPDLMTNLAAANKYLALHHALEPLLASYARNAAAAFCEADRLATLSPTQASSNAVMRNTIANARRALHEPSTAPSAG